METNEATVGFKFNSPDCFNVTKHKLTKMVKESADGVVLAKPHEKASAELYLLSKAA